MFFGIQTYTLNELLDICEACNLDTEIFDADDFNFYFDVINKEQGLKYEFSGRNGNSLQLQDIKPC